MDDSNKPSRAMQTIREWAPVAIGLVNLAVAMGLLRRLQPCEAVMVTVALLSVVGGGIAWAGAVYWNMRWQQQRGFERAAHASSERRRIVSEHRLWSLGFKVVNTGPFAAYTEVVPLGPSDPAVHPEPIPPGCKP